MTTFGYINTSRNKDHLEQAEEVMKQLRCTPLLKETPSEDNGRPFWKHILAEAKKGDTIVLVSFCNAIGHPPELFLLFWICARSKIRLISIIDCIDTEGEFYDTTPRDYVRMLASFYSDMAESKASEVRLKPIMPSKRLTKKRNRQLMYRNIINMYKAGYTAEIIMAQNKVRSKSTVFRILKRFHVPTDRLRNKD